MKRTYWLIILILALLISVGIGIFIQTRQEPRGLAEPMRLELGAAAYLPENTAVYSSSKHILSRVNAIWQSKAVQNLYHLPTIQMGIASLSNQKAFQEGKARFAQQPLVVQGHPILQDALTHEVFIWGGEDLTRFMKVIKEISNSIQMLQLKQGERMASGAADADAELAREMLNILTAHKDELKVPDCMLGFKLTDPEAGDTFLNTWMGKLASRLKVEITQKTIKGHRFYVLQLTGSDIPEDVLADIKSELPDDQQAKILKMIDDQTITITAAVGLLDNYLIVSLGDDLSALEHWGTGPSLAASPRFKPLRARFQSILTDVQYASGEFLSISGWGAPDVDNLSKTGEAMLTAMPAGDIKSNLQPKMRKDLQELCDDLKMVLSKPTDYLGFSCNARGTEWYVIRPGGGLKMEELTLLGHLGPQPIFASVCHAAESMDFYSLAVKWGKAGYGYVKDIAAEKMSDEETAELQHVESILFPCLKRLDKANRDLLFPALAGSQSLTLVDGAGQLTELSVVNGLKMSFENPFPALRAGLAVNLNDADRFKKGVSEYHAAIDSLLTNLKTLEDLPPELKQLKIPEVIVEDQDGGQLYHYPWPWNAGDELFPCAFLKQRFLYVGISKSQARDILTERSAPENPVINLQAPAASACAFKFGPMVTFLEDLNNSVISFITAKSGGNPALGMERMHADALFKSLRAFKTYTSVSRIEGGHVVKHSWLEVKDID